MGGHGVISGGVMSILLAVSLGQLGCGSSSNGGANNPAGGMSGMSAVSGGGSGAANAGGASGSAGAPAQGGSSGQTPSGGAAGVTQNGGAGSVADHALVGVDHGTCALDAAGSIHCWGLGPAVWKVPSGSFVELYSSQEAVCAIAADHTVQCFDEPGLYSGITDSVPTGKVSMVAFGAGGVCSIDVTGVATCDSYTGLTVPLTIPAGESFSQISMGWEFACGIHSADGSIHCWGDAGGDDCSGGRAFKLGQLDAPSGAFVSIATGYYTTCALTKSGAASCWGAAGPSPVACLGNNFTAGQASPPSRTFRSVVVSDNHACGIVTDGTVACWGAGTADQDCPEDSIDCRQSRPPPGQFVQVSVGRLHSCAMTANRKVQCWGYPGLAGDGRTMPPAPFQ